jgi:hypothetical protein
VREPIVLALIAMAVLVGAALAVRRRGGSAAGSMLDRHSRERIRQRIDELGAARVDPALDDGSEIAAGLVADQHRRLWRDTSAVLVLFGSVVLLTMALLQTQPRGAVLEATSAPAGGLRPASPAGVGDPGHAGVKPSERATAIVSPSRPIIATPTPGAAPRPTSAPTNLPANQPRADSGDRMSVLTPCPNRPGCFIYVVRQGDNLVSIANWFGIPYSEVLDRNPQIRNPARVHAGDRITLPPPRR